MGASRSEGAATKSSFLATADASATRPSSTARADQHSEPGSPDAAGPRSFRGQERRVSRADSAPKRSRVGPTTFRHCTRRHQESQSPAPRSRMRQTDRRPRRRRAARSLGPNVPINWLGTPPPELPPRQPASSEEKGRRRQRRPERRRRDADGRIDQAACCGRSSLGSGGRTGSGFGAVRPNTASTSSPSSVSFSMSASLARTSTSRFSASSRVAVS